LSLWQGKRQEARGKNEEVLGDFTFLYIPLIFYVHLLTQILSPTENMQKLGLILIIVSFSPWLAIAIIVPFLPISVAQKALLVPALLVLAEVLFWLGALLLGKEVVQK